MKPLPLAVSMLLFCSPLSCGTSDSGSAISLEISEHLIAGPPASMSYVAVSVTNQSQGIQHVLCQDGRPVYRLEELESDEWKNVTPPIGCGMGMEYAPWSSQHSQVIEIPLLETTGKYRVGVLIWMKEIGPEGQLRKFYWSEPFRFSSKGARNFRDYLASKPPGG